MLGGLAPHVRLSRCDAGMKLTFTEGARTSGQWVRSGRDTPGGTSLAFGPGEHGVTEEKQSLKKSIEKVAPLGTTCKGVVDPSGENLRL